MSRTLPLYCERATALPLLSVTVKSWIVVCDIIVSVEAARSSRVNILFIDCKVIGFREILCQKRTLLERGLLISSVIPEGFVGSSYLAISFAILFANAMMVSIGGSPRDSGRRLASAM